MSGTDLHASGRLPGARAPSTSGARPPSAFGTSPAALARHYDLPAEFFALWLGPELVYSCARWEPDDPGDTLERAQHRKVDHFATALGVRGGRVLDVGCGWGGAADRLQTVHGAAAVVGLTPSPGQAALAASRVGPGVTIREESWSDHEPDAPYDAIVCIEASEHFARDGLAVDDKVAAYRGLLRARRVVAPARRAVGVAGHLPRQRRPPGEPVRRRRDQRPDPLGDLPGVDVLVALGAGPRLGDRLPPGVLPRRAGALRPHLPGLELGAPRAAGRAEELVGPEVHRRFARYFAASRALFRLRQQTLYRIVLSRRPEPKRWVSPPAPVADRPRGESTRRRWPTRRRGPGTSAPAIRAHYDLSNEFYALWLGPSMSYSSGLWTERHP